MGEPAGIGPDVVLASFAVRKERNLPCFYVHGCPHVLASRAKRLGLEIAVHIHTTGQHLPDDLLSVVPLSATLTDQPGRLQDEMAPYVTEAIRNAVTDVHNGYASAVVTAPIAKAPLLKSGFPHAGHTEYLGVLAEELWGEKVEPVMMLASDVLNTVPLTVHIPLMSVAEGLEPEKLTRMIEIVHKDMSKARGTPPRMALAGLNPHAGEDGTLGWEDALILKPLVEALHAKGLFITGPWPADTLFAPHMRRTYDVALCPTHDQALIPIKTLAFERAVNITLGLPFVRTSPDHGTALALAGTGQADPTSFCEALKMAHTWSKHEHHGRT